MDKRAQNKSTPEFSDDSLWVEKIRSGDPAAFESLFNKYCQPLINFANRYVNDTPIAENLVQDVFLKIWTRREELEPTQNIKTYLYTAVRNNALRHIRHLNVVQSSEEKIIAMKPAVKTPEEEWNNKEVADSIQKAVAALPEKCRIIFSMNRFDGLTYGQIAEIQNISIKTVETQMGRALKFLRKSLIHFISVFPL